MTRYCDDGLIVIGNNAAERALRGLVLSRKNFEQWIAAQSVMATTR